MIQPTILAALGAMEITLIVLAVLLLFGGKKIPELMEQNREIFIIKKN